MFCYMLHPTCLRSWFLEHYLPVLTLKAGREEGPWATVLGARLGGRAMLVLMGAAAPHTQVRRSRGSGDAGCASIVCAAAHRKRGNAGQPSRARGASAERRH